MEMTEESCEEDICFDPTQCVRNCMAEICSISFSRFFFRRNSSEPFLFQVSAIWYRTEANIFCLDINKPYFKILQNRQRASLCRNRITNIRYSYRRDRKLRKLCSPDLPCPYRMRSKPQGGRYRLRERYAYKRGYGAWSTS